MTERDERIELMVIKLNQRLGRMPTEYEVMTFIFGTSEERRAIWNRVPR